MDLTRLFSNITNCDLFIAGGEKFSSDLSFQLFLPTVLFTRPKKGKPGLYFEVTKGRAPPCRIVYADDIFALKLGLFGGFGAFSSSSTTFSFPFQPYKYRTGEEYRGITSRENIFPLAFLNNFNELQGLMEWIMENSGLEFLGVLKRSQDGKPEICLVFNGFKFQLLHDSYQLRPESQPCSAVGGEDNVLQIFQKGRQPTKEWSTSGEHLGIWIYNEPDLTTLKQTGNPMNRLGKMLSVHLHHIQAVFSKANSSLILHPYISMSKSNTLFALGVGNFIERNENGEILIMTGVGGYSFLTCYSKEAITFDFYTTPFQPELWYGLLLSYVSLSLLLSLWLFWKKIKSSFCPWLYVLGALLEDGVPILGKLEKNSVFRLVFGCWILICVLLTNCYNGLMIIGLNSPLAAARLVSNFTDLVCDWQEVKYSQNDTNTNFPKSNYDFYINMLVFLYYGRGNKTMNPYSPNNCFSLLSVPEKGSQPFTKDGGILPLFFAFLFEMCSKYGFEHLGLIHPVSLKKFDELELNLLDTKQHHFPKNLTNLQNLSYLEWMSRVEEEVVECGKTVLVLPKSSVQAEAEYLSRTYPATRWFESRDILKPEPEGIAIRRSGISKIPGYYKSLVENGIYSRLNAEYHARNNFRRKPTKKYKPLGNTMTMDGCISTLFIICSLIAGLGLVVFCGEYLPGKIVMAVVACWRHNIWKSCRKKKCNANTFKQKSNRIVVSSVVNVS